MSIDTAKQLASLFRRLCGDFGAKLIITSDLPQEIQPDINRMLENPNGKKDTIDLESRTNMTEKNPIRPFSCLIASCTKGDKKYIFFAGAGVSKDAGLPTAWDLMLKTAKVLYGADNSDGRTDIDLKEWFLRSKYSKMKYAELMDRLFKTPTVRGQFLSESFSKTKPGHVHKQIAELVKFGYIRAIVTTNFDPCIEEALKNNSIEFDVIVTDDDIKGATPLIQCHKTRIYKPHGTIERGTLKNTPKDLERLDPEMERELIKIFCDHGLLIVGFAGDDPDIIKTFEGMKNQHYPSFWVNPTQPDPKLAKLLKDQDIEYIHCDRASLFLAEFLRASETATNLQQTPKDGGAIKENLEKSNLTKDEGTRDRQLESAALRDVEYERLRVELKETLGLSLSESEEKSIIELKKMIGRARTLWNSYRQRRFFKNYVDLKKAHRLIENVEKCVEFNSLDVPELQDPFIVQLKRRYLKETKKIEQRNEIAAGRQERWGG